MPPYASSPTAVSTPRMADKCDGPPRPNRRDRRAQGAPCTQESPDWPPDSSTQSERRRKNQATNEALRQPRTRDRNNAKADDASPQSALAQSSPSPGPSYPPTPSRSNESSPETPDEECLGTTDPPLTVRQNSMGTPPASTGDDHAAANDSIFIQYQNSVGSTPNLDRQHASTPGHADDRTNDDLQDPTLSPG